MANLGKLAIAMLGILAYQNRDKIGDMIRRAGERDPNNPQGGIVDQLSKGVSGTALGDILDRFRTAGAGAKVDSWVGSGPNQPIEPRDVETAIDEETLTSLSMQTGLSRDELIARITKDLPEAVNKLTPDGELPAVGPTQGSSETTLLDDVPSRTTQASRSEE
ncbi:YidB family protein [Mesorhizobium amorphae]|uniref:YidB family protein n=1 Tax=Mesorhizobium amorphae TaxID=71433 RepID=UPI003ECE519A